MARTKFIVNQLDLSNTQAVAIPIAIDTSSVGVSIGTAPIASSKFLVKGFSGGIDIDGSNGSGILAHVGSSGGFTIQSDGNGCGGFNCNMDVGSPIFLTSTHVGNGGFIEIKSGAALNIFSNNDNDNQISTMMLQNKSTIGGNIVLQNHDGTQLINLDPFATATPGISLINATRDIQVVNNATADGGINILNNVNGSIFIKNKDLADTIFSYLNLTNTAGGTCQIYYENSLVQLNSYLQLPTASGNNAALYYNNNTTQVTSNLYLPTDNAGVFQLYFNDAINIMQSKLLLPVTNGGPFSLYFSSPTVLSQLTMPTTTSGTIDLRTTDVVAQITSYLTMPNGVGSQIELRNEDNTNSRKSYLYLPNGSDSQIELNNEDSTNSRAAWLKLPSAAGSAIELRTQDQAIAVDSYSYLNLNNNGNGIIASTQDILNNRYATLNLSTAGATKGIDIYDNTLQKAVRLYSNSMNDWTMIATDVNVGSSQFRFYTNTTAYGSDWSISRASDSKQNSINMTEDNGIFVNCGMDGIRLYDNSTTDGGIQLQNATSGKIELLNDAPGTAGIDIINSANGNIKIENRATASDILIQHYVGNCNVYLNSAGAVTIAGTAAIELNNTVAGKVKVTNASVSTGGIEITNSGNGDIAIANNFATGNITLGATFTQITGGIKSVFTSIDDTDSPYAVTNQSIILADATSGNITINLPTATIGNKQVIKFKHTGTANNVVITPNGAETIDGGANITLTTLQYATIISDGVTWWKIE